MLAQASVIEFSMAVVRFSSWNVNGLRAAISKGFFDWASGIDADFICLQETKLSSSLEFLELPEYEKFYNYAERKGYSGTAIFSRKKPISVRYGIGDDYFDKEGRVITLEMDNFFLVCVYVPNSQRELARLGFRREWNSAFEEYLVSLDQVKPVVVTGDLNVAHKEIDLKNPKSNERNAGFSIEERDDFSHLLSRGFIDTFRLLHPDEVKYSWWSYMFQARAKNAGWRIDYFLVSKRLESSVLKADILTDVLGSDHCPVLLELDI